VRHAGCLGGEVPFCLLTSTFNHRRERDPVAVTSTRTSRSRRIPRSAAAGESLSEATRRLPMAPWDPSYPVPPNLLDLVRANAWAPPNLPLFRPAPSQFAGMADDQRQPSTLGASGANNARSAPFSDWPLAPTTASSTGANSSGIPPGSFPEHDDNNPHSAYAARLLEDAKRSHDFALWAFGSPSARRAPNVFAEGPYETASQFSGPGRTSPWGRGAKRKHDNSSVRCSRQLSD
jgi:hypothetical protein